MLHTVTERFVRKFWEKGINRSVTVKIKSSTHAQNSCHVYNNIPHTQLHSFRWSLICKTKSRKPPAPQPDWIPPINPTHTIFLVTPYASLTTCNGKRVELDRKGALWCCEIISCSVIGSNSWALSNSGTVFSRIAPMDFFITLQKTIQPNLATDLDHRSRWRLISISSPLRLKTFKCICVLFLHATNPGPPKNKLYLWLLIYTRWKLTTCPTTSNKFIENYEFFSLRARQKKRIAKIPSTSAWCVGFICADHKRGIKTSNKRKNMKTRRTWMSSLISVEMSSNFFTGHRTKSHTSL